MSSDPQKDVLAVEVIEEQPADRHVGKRRQRLVPGGGKERPEAVEEEFVRLVEADDLLREVDRDRVYADDAQEQRPPPPMPHVDEPVEEREDRRRIRADDQHERR